MKLSNFPKTKKSRFTTLAIIVGCIFFFNCSELYFSPYNCVEDGTRDCKQNGDIGWLERKSMDILITLDNSSKGQDLNPRVTSNLTQFLKCMEAVDWKVGIIPGVKGSNSEGSLGVLMNTEISGQVSAQKFITSDTTDHKQAFSDTISLRSGCSFPPYCSDGSIKPLSAIKSFMHKQVGREGSFLREGAAFAVIVVSSKDESSGMFSGDSTDAQSALASVYEHYTEDEFIGLVVTGSNTRDDCIDQSSNFISTGVEYLGKVGGVYSLVTMNPLVMLASSLLVDFSDATSIVDQSPVELINFAKGSGGYVFDICKPSFGKVLAFSLLKKMGKEDRFPEECKQFKKLQEEMDPDQIGI